MILKYYLKTPLYIMLALCISVAQPSAAPAQVKVAQVKVAKIKVDWGKRYETALENYHDGKFSIAHKEFLALADVGSAPAQTLVGHMYLNGEGVEKSPGVAAMWFYRAASRGYVPAQLAFGHVRETGNGMQRNLVAAAMWYMIVEKRGNEKLSALAKTFLERVSKQLTPEVLITARNKANRWRPDNELTP